MRKTYNNKRIVKRQVQKKISEPMNLKDRVIEALNEIRPAIQMDGGDVQLLDIDEKKGIVTIHLSGACQGCPLSEITLKQGIEQTLKSFCPEISEVITDD